MNRFASLGPAAIVRAATDSQSGAHAIRALNAGLRSKTLIGAARRTEWLAAGVLQAQFGQLGI